MSTSRLNTVYDLSALRLHPDGSRVKQSCRNLRARNGKSSIRDAHGNWIASDAGGSGRVKRRKVVPTREDEGTGKDEAEDTGGGENIGGSLALPKSYGARKRREFTEDMSFLEPQTSIISLSHELALPSSDLLKAVHYHAAQYYHARGQLSNVARQYRQERKEQKKRKLEMDSDIADAEDESTTKTKAKRTLVRDMYKRMDGSALIAIGMLVQEHIARLLDVEPPEGCEVDSRDGDEQGESAVEDEDASHLEVAPREDAQDKDAHSDWSYEEEDP